MTRTTAAGGAGRKVSASTEPVEGTADRLADHAAIGRLADDLLPALVAKLSASGLGEIEVAEGGWRVRVRRAGDGSAQPLARRSSDRASRSQPGHAGHGHAPASFEGHRSAREGRSPGPASSTNGSSGSDEGPLGSATTGETLAGDGEGLAGGDGARPGAGPAGPPGSIGDPYRAVATSPAVGVYHPRPEARAGSRVRAGDRLGAVDLLGIPQQVVAPADGIVGASLVEAGQAVEYGQELVVIELATQPAERSEA